MMITENLHVRVAETCVNWQKKILEWIMEKLFGRDKWEDNMAK